jgi:hypothetical protein
MECLRCGKKINALRKLLGGSVPLADYRLEFLAQIDKKVVASRSAWQTRAITMPESWRNQSEARSGYFP